jgi:uncharacterized protein with GYD domain
MATYFMFGQYSPASVGKISASRTADATAVIGDCGGKVKAGYALLGKIDLVLIVDFPSNDAAMKASVALSKLLDIGFTTAPALSVEEFDKLVG